MIRHTHQIGGVTVSFTMGHVNELRGAGSVDPSPIVAQGAGPQCLAPHDWLLTVPGIPAGWGSSFHEVEPKA